MAHQNIKQLWYGFFLGTGVALFFIFFLIMQQWPSSSHRAVLALIANFLPYIIIMIALAGGSGLFIAWAAQRFQDNRFWKTFGFSLLVYLADAVIVAFFMVIMDESFTKHYPVWYEAAGAILLMGIIGAVLYGLIMVPLLALFAYLLTKSR